MLERHGISTLVLDSGSRVGDRWRERYDGLRLNTVRWMSDLPGYRMNRRFGRWPSRDAWAAYLEQYAHEHDLAIQPDTTVERVDHADGRWRLTTATSGLEADAVIIATGLDRIPKIPAWPGVGDFEGELVHSSGYRSPEDYRGRDVLVVGSGNSAFEIADFLSRGGARHVSIAIRRPPIIVRREYFGIPLTVFSLLGRVFPDRALDWIGWTLPPLFLGDLSRHGIPRPRRRLSDMRREKYVPPVDSGFVDSVKRGAITVVDAVERLDGPDVVLSDGSRLAPDVVIAATGYRTALEPIVGHLNVLREDETPIVHGPQTLPDTPGLYFIGFHFVLTATLPHLSTEARAIAETVARARVGRSAPNRVGLRRWRRLSPLRKLT